MQDYYKDYYKDQRDFNFERYYRPHVPLEIAKCDDDHINIYREVTEPYFREFVCICRARISTIDSLKGKFHPDDYNIILQKIFERI